MGSISMLHVEIHPSPGPLSVLQEITDLRRTLNTEVDSLRGEFMELKGALKQQLDLTAQVATVQVSGAVPL